MTTAAATRPRRPAVRTVEIYASMAHPALYHFCRGRGPGSRHVATIRVERAKQIRGLTASEAVEAAAIDERVEWARTELTN